MASKSSFRQCFYTELDVMLDTRLGTLARLGDETAIAVLSSGYHQRESDEFPHVDLQAYRDLYARRDQETLAKSACTGSMELLRQLTLASTEQAVVRPFHSGPKVFVNLHPYALTAEELDELREAIAAWLSGTSSDIEFLSIPKQGLTPDTCKAMGFAAMFLYDYGEWMEMHAKAFETTRLNETTVFGPAIYLKVPTEEERVQLVKDVGSAFHAMEMLASPLIDLKLLPVSEFSVIVKPTSAA